MRELEAENAGLQRMYADLALENAAIKDVPAKNSDAVREAAVVSAMVTGHRLPVTRTCRAAGLSRAAYDKTPPQPQEKDAEVIDALNGAFVNQVLALEFIHDALYDGRRFRTFNVIGEANREALAIQVNDIEPGEPNQSAYIERCNRTFRTEVLDAWLFNSLEQVQAIADNWLIQYNA